MKSQIFDIYRMIEAEKVDQDAICINLTSFRTSMFDAVFMGMFVGCFILTTVFNYNTMSLVELVATALGLLFSIVIYKFRAFICYKTIVFNRTQGTIEFRRTFPYVNKTFKLEEVQFIERQPYDSGRKSSYFFIVDNNSKRKYLICTTSVATVPGTFFDDFMHSKDYLIKRIKNYNRQEDPEIANTSYNGFM